MNHVVKDGKVLCVYIIYVLYTYIYICMFFLMISMFGFDSLYQMVQFSRVFWRRMGKNVHFLVCWYILRSSEAIYFWKSVRL